MVEIKPDPPSIDEDYYCMEENGVLKCSCGKELIKIDEETWGCASGSIRYKLEDGDIVTDKFGNIMLRHKEHDN